MNKKLLFGVVIIFATVFLASCSKDNVSSSDVTASIDGPNSIKGIISGTMKDTAVAFNIPFDFHVSAGDNSYYSDSESWIEDNSENPIYDGDSVLWLEQYFFIDRNTISALSDGDGGWSVSNQYVYLEFYMDMKTMKLMPLDYSYNEPYLEGMWQKTTAWGTRFVYGETFSANTASGTLTITELKYDKGSQILSGKLNMTLPESHTQNNWYSNNHAANLTADFKIYVPKESFEVTKKGSYYGQNYRKRAH